MFYDDPLVSIIIPAYNASNFLHDCIESVRNQTYQHYELIIIDDGSVDETLSTAKRFQLRDNRIRVYALPNQGQGHARNKGLSLAKGEYILFLDADDTIEPTALMTALTRIQEDGSDFATFSFKYFKGDTQNYSHTERFFGEHILIGHSQVNRLLDSKAYFSVIRLYKRSFLVQNELAYAEGHLYEDNPFFVATILCATRVSIIHSPLYNVRIHSGSSTKSDSDTEKHYKGYIAAVEKCISELTKHKDDKGIEEARYYYLFYASRRFMLYYYERVPKCYRKQYMQSFLQAVRKLGSFPIMFENDRYLSFCKRYAVFQKEKYWLFRALTFYMRRARRLKKKFQHRCSNAVKKNQQLKAFQPTLDEIRSSNTILFLGFDHRYTGNSRYLFESLQQRVEDSTARMIFATDSCLVSERYRVAPGTPEFFQELATARILIFESWIPQTYKKRGGQYWIQLWHGVPLKKMLFDSEEKAIFSKNPRSKNRHYADIRHWNFFLVESELEANLFQTAFLMPPHKMLLGRYPRVRYLITNRNNSEIKNAIADKFSIDLNKIIVLYLPTWRDYNYECSDKEMDFSYLLNTADLQQALGNDYSVISKDHIYLHSSNNETEVLPEDETQELLLIADCVVTDYSSVLFDAFAANIQVALYVTDYARFADYRGVYPSIWKNLQPLVSENIQDLATKIKQDLISDEYKTAQNAFIEANVPKYSIDNFIIRHICRKSSLPEYLFVVTQADVLEKSLEYVSRHLERFKSFENVLFVTFDHNPLPGNLNLGSNSSHLLVSVASMQDVASFEKEITPLFVYFTSKDYAIAYEKAFPNKYRDSFVLDTQCGETSLLKKAD